MNTFNQSQLGFSKATIMSILFLTACISTPQNSKQTGPNPVTLDTSVEETGVEIDEQDTSDTIEEQEDTSEELDTTPQGVPYDQAYFKSMHNSYSGQERESITGKHGVPIGIQA